MKDYKKKYEPIFNSFIKSDKNKDIDSNPSTMRDIGCGENALVKEVRYKKKSCAAKLTEKLTGIAYSKNLRGPNLLKTHQILETKYDGNYYNIIIMEKALLRDLGKLAIYLQENNFLKLINNPFFEIIGNNLVKYITKEIVKGLETLDRNELVHYDLKLENILIESGFKIKISYFSFLINLKEYKKNNEKLKIPKETRGYMTPEYFRDDERYDAESIKKQDYFALGASLFLLIMGGQMLKYKKSDEQLSEDRIIDLLQRDIAHLESNALLDNDMVEFIKDLIQYIPDERPSFEFIYRNKWLNKDFNYILPLTHTFLKEEEDKLIKELVKSDFIMEKQKSIENELRRNFEFVE